MSGKPLIKFRCLRKCAPWPYYPGELFGVEEAEARILPVEYFERVVDAPAAAPAMPVLPERVMPTQAPGRSSRR